MIISAKNKDLDFFLSQFLTMLWIAINKKALKITREVNIKIKGQKRVNKKKLLLYRQKYKMDFSNLFLTL